MVIRPGMANAGTECKLQQHKTKLQQPSCPILAACSVVPLQLRRTSSKAGPCTESQLLIAGVPDLTYPHRCAMDRTACVTGVCTHHGCAQAASGTPLLACELVRFHAHVSIA